MQRTCLLVFATALFFSSTAAFSQKNELSFSAGGTFTSDQRTAVVFPCPPVGPPCFNEFAGLFQTDPGVVLEATYARRITRFGPASLYFELPVIGVPDRDVQSSIMIAGLGGTGPSPGSSASAF